MTSFAQLQKRGFKALEKTEDASIRRKKSIRREKVNNPPGGRTG